MDSRPESLQVSQPPEWCCCCWPKQPTLGTPLLEQQLFKAWTQTKGILLVPALRWQDIRITMPGPGQQHLEGGFLVILGHTVSRCRGANPVSHQHWPSTPGLSQRHQKLLRYRIYLHNCHQRGLKSRVPCLLVSAKLVLLKYTILFYSPCFILFFFSHTPIPLIMPWPCQLPPLTPSNGGGRWIMD